jgi:hypothetical protein
MLGGSYHHRTTERRLGPTEDHVFEFQVPWFIDESLTMTTTLYCPWAQHDVEARFLTCGGQPVSLIGCSERACSMSCLAEAPVPDPVTEAE